MEGWNYKNNLTTTEFISEMWSCFNIKELTPPPDALIHEITWYLWDTIRNKNHLTSIDSEKKFYIPALKKLSRFKWKPLFLNWNFYLPKCIVNFILNEVKLKSTASSHDLSSMCHGPGQCYKEGNGIFANLEYEYLTIEFLGLL